MTFSLLLHDPETGEFGSVISSSSPAVGARCVSLADGVGGAHSQNVTDPRLGGQLIEQMRAGKNAQDALDAVVSAADQEAIDFRQLLVIDATGKTAAHSGSQALGTFGEVCRAHAVAGGNMLKDLGVLDALVATAQEASGSLEERLLAGFRAALEAGGEEGPVHSAALSVVASAGWRVTDLRVDWAEHDTLERLEELVDLWLPQREDYVKRGHAPQGAPSYGVPGDE